MVPSPVDGRRILFATKHGKQEILAPLFRQKFQAEVAAVKGLDTDQFGSFSGEVARRGDQRQAARAKVDAAHRLTGAPLVLASEGSFAPHPSLPWLTWNLELLLLRDFEQDWEVEAWASSLDPSAARLVPHSLDEALDWARKQGFPDQGILVFQPSGVEKELTDLRTLEHCLREAAEVMSAGQLRLETDLRAHRNPRRRQVLLQAGENLAAALTALCPECSRPGFVAQTPLPGRPCADCGRPTDQPLAWQARCPCGCSRDTPAGAGPAEARHCPWCNP